MIGVDVLFAPQRPTRSLTRGLVASQVSCRLAFTCLRSTRHNLLSCNGALSAPTAGLAPKALTVPVRDAHKANYSRASTVALIASRSGVDMAMSPGRARQPVIPKSRRNTPRAYAGPGWLYAIANKRLALAGQQGLSDLPEGAKLV